MIGKTLGHYQITSQLGKGGMGEVFRAKDRVLGRDVAIKVLPEEFAKDSDRVARFQREAKLLASLNHANIAAIYGLEESAGTNFLVLELVEGETLATRIKQGPIPVEDVLKLALQIAEALEAAHEKGVIHRDLKPANIKVTPDGKVKVLDFGLAKAYAGDQEVNLSNSPTLSNLATQQGIILGTAAYMAPEQARGKIVDKRADIWAFGCVLYEMLAGRQTWSGDTVTDVIAAALAKDPDFSRLPPNLHPDIRKLVSRCLQKDPAERFRDVGDVRVEIKQVLADPNGLFVQQATAAKPRRRARVGLPWVAAAVVLAAIIAGVAVWRLKPAEPRQVVRFGYELPEGRQFSNPNYPALAISPDGKQIVYTTEKGLYLRSVDELTDKLIVGTEESTSQSFFSPDGKWIGYFSVADVKLKKISINGGAAITVCGCTPYGAGWDTENTIVYGQLNGDVMRVSANGGKPESLVKGKAELHWRPQMLPDGKSVLYTGSRSINVQSVRSGESKELFPGAVARYLQTGHIIYFSPESNSIFAVPFDLDRLEVKGGQVPIVEGVLDFAVSDSGTLVYIPGQTGAGAADRRTLVWVDRKGKEVSIAAQPNSYEDLHISPDGTKVALDIRAGEKSDIWIWDLLRETMSRLTFDGASYCPLWTADGKRIAFGSERESKAGIYWKAADGTGGEQKLGSVTDQAYMLPWSWSGDGKTLVTLEGTDAANRNIGAISMEGDRKWRPLLHENYYEAVPQISPDGRWMAYCSSESGSIEVYVRPFPDVNAGKWQVSGKGAECPVWAPDGKALFYQTSDAMMAVPVETQPTFQAGKPEPLFRGTYAHWSDTDGHPWDIHPDGKRFLMIKPSGSPAGRSTAEKPATALPRPKINIVLNWTEELKQRVPVK